MLGAETQAASLVTDYLQTVTDPAHVLTELTYLLIVDGLVLGLFWGVFGRAWLRRRDARLSARIHNEVETCDGHDIGRKRKVA